MNNEPIWFGRKQGAAVFSHAWISREGLELEILATTRKVSARHVAPDFRNYDLVINGRLFDTLPVVGGADTMSHSMDDQEPALDLPRSIVEILYPNGYTWKESPGSSMINNHEQDVDYKEADMSNDEEDVAYDEKEYYAPVTPQDLLDN